MRPSLLFVAAAASGAFAYDLVSRQRDFGECTTVCSAYSESLRVCRATMPNDTDITSCLCTADNAASVQGCINCASQTGSAGLLGAAQGIVDAFSQACAGMGMASITAGGPGGSGGFTGSASRPSTTGLTPGTPGASTPRPTGTTPVQTGPGANNGPGASSTTSGARGTPSTFPDGSNTGGAVDVMKRSVVGLGLAVSFVVAAVAL